MELERANIKISMDHKGRCFDNIFVERLWRTLKQEAIYYYRPNSIRDLNLIINDFVGWYNYKRRHQTLHYKVPADLYYHKQYMNILINTLNVCRRIYQHIHFKNRITLKKMV